MGIREASYLPAALAMIAFHHGEATRSRATGLRYSGIYVGIVLGVLVAVGWVSIMGGVLPFSFLGHSDRI
jgi:hypothetical protein